jgi:hypothetical protein
MLERRWCAMCYEYDYFFDRARIAEEMRKNRKKAQDQKPPVEAAPTAPVAEPKPVVEEPVPVS